MVAEGGFVPVTTLPKVREGYSLDAGFGSHVVSFRPKRILIQEYPQKRLCEYVDEKEWNIDKRQKVESFAEHFECTLPHGALGPTKNCIFI